VSRVLLMAVDWMAAMIVLIIVLLQYETYTLLSISLGRSTVLRLCFSCCFEGVWHCQQYTINSTIIEMVSGSVDVSRLQDEFCPMNVLDPTSILCYHISARIRVGMRVKCPAQTPAVLPRLPGPSTAHSPSQKAVGRGYKLTTTTHAPVRPLSRNSKSVVSSDAIRHMRAADMKEFAESGSKESHAPRHSFGDPRFALPAPSHLEAPVPWIGTALCRYPVGLLSAVGAGCVDFQSDEKVVRASDANDPSLTKGKGF
jgi:hypothetical protein